MFEYRNMEELRKRRPGVYFLQNATALVVHMWSTAKKTVTFFFSEFRHVLEFRHPASLPISAQKFCHKNCRFVRETVHLIGHDLYCFACDHTRITCVWTRTRNNDTSMTKPLFCNCFFAMCENVFEILYSSTVIIH